MRRIVDRLVAKLVERDGAQLRPASAEDLAAARTAGFPDELIEFYRHWEPEDCIELKQRIWSIKNSLVENTDAVPGCVLFPQGFVVFASNLFGDSYCVDTNATTPDGDHPIVLFSHEMIEEDTPLSDIIPLRLEVASSFKDFLVKFTEETLAEEPLYG